MYTEYVCLAIMGLFSLFAFLPASIGKVQTLGLGWAAGNRGQPLRQELPDWVGRAERAHNNLKDNLPAFIIAVLLLGLTNHFSHFTAIACIVYVIARIGHMLVYIAGLKLPRTLTFFAGVAANVFLYFCLL